MNYQQHVPYGQQQVQDTNPSCRQLMSQPVQFNQNYMPPVVNLGMMPQHIQAVGPLIAIQTANTVSSLASTNPIFTFYFNLLSQNNWRNSHFERLSVLAAQYTLLLQVQNIQQNVVQAVGMAANDVVPVLASVTAIESQALVQFVTPDLWKSVIEKAERFGSIMQQFAQLGIGQQSQPVYQQPMQAAPAYQQAPVMGGFQSQPQQGVAVYTPGPIQPLVGFTNQAPAQGVQQTQTGVNYRSRAPIVAPSVQQQQEEHPGIKIPGFGTEQPQPAAKVTHFSKTGVTENTIPQFGVGPSDYHAGKANAALTPKEVTKAVMEQAIKSGWQTHADQFFEPAVDSNEEKHEYTVVFNPGSRTTLTSSIVKKDQKEIEMDRAAHTITTAHQLYQARVPGNVSNRKQGVSEALEMVAKAITATTSMEPEEVTDYFRKLELVADPDSELASRDSLYSIIVAARLQRINYQSTSKSFAFMTSGQKIHHFIARTGLSQQLFDKIREYKTLESLAVYLKRFADDHQDPAAATLIWRVDRFITQELKQLINKRLGLNNFKFDSFIDDISAIYSVMQEDWGMAFSNALRRYEREFLDGIFGPKNFSYCDLEDSEEKVAVTETPVTVTLVDADSKEFGIRIEGNKSYEVLSSNFPGFYEFIVAIVRANPDTHRHYVVTEDDLVYEVNTSIVGNSVPLVSIGPKIS